MEMSRPQHKIAFRFIFSSRSIKYAMDIFTIDRCVGGGDGTCRVVIESIFRDKQKRNIKQARQRLFSVDTHTHKLAQSHRSTNVVRLFVWQAPPSWETTTTMKLKIKLTRCTQSQQIFVVFADFHEISAASFFSSIWMMIRVPTMPTLRLIKPIDKIETIVIVCVSVSGPGN